MFFNRKYRVVLLLSKSDVLFLNDDKLRVSSLFSIYSIWVAIAAIRAKGFCVAEIRALAFFFRLCPFHQSVSVYQPHFLLHLTVFYFQITRTSNDLRFFIFGVPKRTSR